MATYKETWVDEVSCYCGAPAVLVDSGVIYGGRSFGPIWICSKHPKCDGYVGCHKGTTKPLGTLCNHGTRQARKLAHAAFDIGWQAKLLWKNRAGAYAWMRKVMKMDEQHAHIAMMDEDTCYKLVGEIDKLRRRRDK